MSRMYFLLFHCHACNNKKNQLYSDNLFLNVSFQGKTEANIAGKQYVNMLVNVLWYVD